MIIHLLCVKIKILKKVPGPGKSKKCNATHTLIDVVVADGRGVVD